MIDHETEALNSPKSSWWDDEFTRLLLEAIPADAETIVEIGCGNARAVHSLLPSLPDARYVGFSEQPELIAAAEEALEAVPYRKRATIRVARAEDLPMENGSADVALSLMTLQHSMEVEQALAELYRVLRPMGRMIAIEPDNLGQRFYFNGVLEEINDRYHKLCLRARVARQPADIAVGPRVGQLMQAAGFGAIRVAVHGVHSSRAEDAKSFFGRLRKICQATVKDAGLNEDAEEFVACDQAINRCLFAGIPKRIGFSTHMVPVFRYVGQKPSLSGSYPARR